MRPKRNNRRRVRFELLEDRKVLNAGGLILADGLDDSAEALVGDSTPAMESSGSDLSGQAAVVQQTAGTLFLDPAIIGGVQNDLVLSVGIPLANTQLSGTIEIGTVTADDGQLTGFTVSGGAISATDTSGIIELSNVMAVPLDINPGINPVSGGTFDSSEVGISINSGIATVSLVDLTYDFGDDPVEGPGSGTGTVVVNSFDGNDYNITVSIPVALELEAAPGTVASVDGIIVASGMVTVPEDPSVQISQFYNQIKQSIESDQLYSDLVGDAKAAIDSGELTEIQQVYTGVLTTTEDLVAAAINSYSAIASDIDDPDELNNLYYSLIVVLTEVQIINDFLITALSSPADYQQMSLGEFADELVQDVQEQLFDSPPSP